MRYLSLALILLLPAPLYAQEAVALTVTKTFATPPSITAYQPGVLYLDLIPVPRIFVRLAANGELQDPFEYPKDCKAIPPSVTPVCANLDTEAEVATLIGQLNTVNLVTRSLWRRIFDRLVADFPARFPGGATVQ